MFICTFARIFRLDDYKEALVGIKIPKNSGPLTSCCGSSGGLSMRRDREATELMDKISSMRLKYLSKYGNEVVTPCVKCYLGLFQASLKTRAKVRPRHIFDLPVSKQ